MSQCIYVPDIECDSCVKRINRVLKKNNITNYSIDQDSVVVDDNTNSKKVISLIQSAGYRADTQPFERKSFKERIRHFKENKKAYAVEIMGLKNSFYILASLLLLFGFAYFSMFKNIDNFMSIYGWWIFYLIISVVSIGVAAWHYYAYKTKVTCMTGMMIGMTFGMQTGMMIGAIIGATNGFFWGAMSGMLIGTGIGIMTGKCCGVMGFMEGAMAGVMGGTMGPMITVMMFSDNVLWFMPFYMLINLAIIAGLSYMLYEELVEGKEVKIKPLDRPTLLAVSIIITSLLVWLMVYGPSSALISWR